MEKSNQVKISDLNIDMASVICQNSRDNLYAFMKRMDLEVNVSWEKEVLAVFLKDTILEHPEYILSIYGKETLDFLVELWESDQIELYQNSWNILGQLRLLGLVDIGYAMEANCEPSVIYMVQEARDAFYYYLKSKTAKTRMDYYYNWEVMIRGLLSYYGIISFHRLYYLFCRVLKTPVDDRDLHRFLSVRMELFHFGTFSLEKHSNVEYYQSYEVANPEEVLEKRLEMEQKEYCLPEAEDLIYSAQNNGMGDWDGVSDLAEIFLQLLQVEYYKTVVTIKSCILMIQNDEEPRKVEEYLIQCCPEIQKFRDKMRETVLSLYNSVPVYSLKGWNRKAIRKKQRSRLPFRMLQGGKQESEERRT